MSVAIAYQKDYDLPQGTSIGFDPLSFRGRPFRGASGGLGLSFEPIGLPRGRLSSILEEGRQGILSAVGWLLEV